MAIRAERVSAARILNTSRDKRGAAASIILNSTRPIHASSEPFLATAVME
jgi:hypothetical protein